MGIFGRGKDGDKKEALSTKPKTESSPEHLQVVIQSLNIDENLAAGLLKFITELESVIHPETSIDDLKKIIKGIANRNISGGVYKDKLLAKMLTNPENGYPDSLFEDILEFLKQRQQKRLR